MRVEGINETAAVKNIRPINTNERQSYPKDGQQEKLTNNDFQSKNSENKLSEEEIIKAIESANNKFEMHNTQLEFSIHEKTKEIMVKIKDSNTGEVIKELPPEKILDMVAGLLELAGIIVDEKA